MSVEAAVIGGVERNALDPRVQRTQAALLAAFNRLFLQHGYEVITPARIAAAARIGRSTFYEHFAGKEALLRHSITPVLRPLAEASAGREAPNLLVTLCHFWDNRRLARRMIVARSGMILRDQLAQLIEQVLLKERSPCVIPLPLIALSKAAAQIALIEAWLSGRHACNAKQLAIALVGDLSSDNERLLRPDDAF